MCLLGMTITAITSYRSYTIFFNDYQSMLTERMQHVSKSLDSMISDTDYLGMTRQVNSILLTEGVVGVRVVDRNNEPIIHKGVLANFILEESITRTKERIGLIQVAFSDTPVKEKVISLIREDILLGIFLTPLIAYLMWLFCGWKFKDIIRLSNDVHRIGDIAQEEVDLPGTRRHDEIGHLARTLTERSNLIKEGKRQEQLLYQAIDQSHDSILITNEQGDIEYVNPAFSRITGYSRKEIEGKNPRILKSEKHPPKFYELLWNTLTSGKTWNGRLVNRRKNNELYHEQATITPVIGPAGDIHHYVAVKRDITQELLLEEQLNQAQKMEAVGLMAGGVAHDLNNILSGVVGYPELLLMQLPENSSLRQPIEEIQNSGKRAAEIVDDLLTIARGIAAKRETKNLNELVIDYLESPELKKLQSLHPETACSTKLDKTLWNFSCSAIHIRKCIMNLVTNAIEAISSHGEVVISTENLTIDKPDSADSHFLGKGDYVVLTVADTGKGIPEKHLSRIFEPFYSKKAIGRSGTGLGLAVVWNTVADHDGKINVESDDSGTSFTLFFPATPEIASLTKKEEHAAAHDFQGKGEQILVVDDEPQLLDIAKNMLETMGYAVHTVSSGEEALDYLSQHPVELILLDMLMEPGINGTQTYREIIKTYPRQKALIVTGFSKSQEVEEAIELGAGGIIKKPYVLKELVSAVHDQLNSQ